MGSFSCCLCIRFSCGPLVVLGLRIVLSGLEIALLGFGFILLEFGFVLCRMGSERTMVLLRPDVAALTRLSMDMSCV